VGAKGKSGARTTSNSRRDRVGIKAPIERKNLRFYVHLLGDNPPETHAQVIDKTTGLPVVIDKKTGEPAVFNERTGKPVVIDKRTGKPIRFTNKEIKARFVTDVRCCEAARVAENLNKPTQPKRKKRK